MSPAYSPRLVSNFTLLLHVGIKRVLARTRETYLSLIATNTRRYLCTYLYMCAFFVVFLFFISITARLH